jgi:hypothetical protein
MSGQTRPALRARTPPHRPGRDTRSISRQTRPGVRAGTHRTGQGATRHPCRGNAPKPPSRRPTAPARARRAIHASQTRPSPRARTPTPQATACSPSISHQTRPSPRDTHRPHRPGRPDHPHHHKRPRFLGADTSPHGPGRYEHRSHGKRAQAPETHTDPTDQGALTIPTTTNAPCSWEQTPRRMGQGGMNIDAASEQPPRRTGQGATRHPCHRNAPKPPSSHPAAPARARRAIHLTPHAPKPPRPRHRPGQATTCHPRHRNRAQARPAPTRAPRCARRGRCPTRR